MLGERNVDTRRVGFLVYLFRLERAIFAFLFCARPRLDGRGKASGEARRRLGNSMK